MVARGSRQPVGMPPSRRLMYAYQFGRRLAAEHPDIVQSLLEAGDDLRGYMTDEEREACSTTTPHVWALCVRRGYEAQIITEADDPDAGPA